MAAWTTNAFGSYDDDDGDNDDDIISLQSESMHSMIDAFPVASSSAAAASKAWSKPAVPVIQPRRSSSLQMNRTKTPKSAFASTSSSSSSSSLSGRSGHGRSSRPRPSSQHDTKNSNNNGSAPPSNSVKDPSCSSSSSSSRRKHQHYHHHHPSGNGGHMSSSSHSTGRGSLGGSGSSHSLGGSSSHSHSYSRAGSGAAAAAASSTKDDNNNKSSGSGSRIRRTSSSSSKGNNDSTKNGSPSASSKNGRSSLSSSGRRHSHQNGTFLSSSFKGSDKLTIGESSGLGSSTRVFPPPPSSNNDSFVSLPVSERKSTSSSRLPDLFTLEQALADCDDDTRRVERILNQSMSLQNREFQTTSGGGNSSRSQRSHSLSETPGVAWKTPFEVDAPREAPNRPHSPSNTTTASEEITITTNDGRRDGGDGDNRRLTEEQDAWAGIDKLLDPENFDDSFTFSTMDILPCKTVKAMRREGSFSTLDVSVMNGDDNEDEGDDDRTEFTASFEVLQRVKEKQEKMRKLKMEKSNGTSMMPSLVEASDQDEDNNDESFTRRLQQLPQQQQGGGQDGQNKLFSVFHWSDKQNVDEERRRKGKLNQTRNNNKLNLQPDPFDPASTHDSDTMSLPSLATFRDDDMSVRSDLSSVYEVGSVVSSDFSRRNSLDPSRRNSLDPSRRNSLDPSRRNSLGPSSIHSQQQEQVAQQGLFSIEDKPFDPPMEFGFETGTDPPAATNQQPTPLVFDKQVDDYIRKVQEHLPTIAEYDGPGSPSKSKRGPSVGSWLEAKVSPTPSAALQEDSSVIDDLPSLASLGTTPAPGNDDGDKKGGRRKEKKKDPTQSLLGSIKKFGKGGNPKPKAKGSNVAAGDEEKYFPDAKKEKEVKANKGLLNSDDEGNWD